MTSSSETPRASAEAPARRAVCLSEMSVANLLVAALAVSGALWLAVAAVL